MSEDIYFDASHKFREPRKFKKSSYKPKGKEYKYIDPAEGLIQQVETKIVKPKRMKKVKKEMEPIEKRFTDILESRRKIREGRQVGRTVDPDELLRIQELQKRAIVPSTKMEMERVAKEKEEQAKAKALTDAQAEKLLMQNRHAELINRLGDIVNREDIDVPMIFPPSDLLDDAEPQADKDKQFKEYERQLNYLNLQQNKKLREQFIKWLKTNNLFNKKLSTVVAKPVGSETNDDFRKRAHYLLSNYRTFKAKTGRGLFGGKLAQVHPHLLGTLITHDYVHRHADKVLAKIPRGHEDIKKLQELKKNAKRAVLYSNKKYGGAFSDFFKKMVNSGKSLVNVVKNIPNVAAPYISKGVEMAKPLIREHAGTAVQTAVSNLPIPFAGTAGNVAKKGVDWLTSKFIKDKPKEPYNPYALI